MFKKLWFAIGLLILLWVIFIAGVDIGYRTHRPFTTQETRAFRELDAAFFSRGYAAGAAKGLLLLGEPNSEGEFTKWGDKASGAIADGDLEGFNRLMDALTVELRNAGEAEGERL